MPDYYNDNAKSNVKALKKQFAPYGDVSVVSVENAILITTADTRAAGDRERVIPLQEGIEIVKLEIQVISGRGAAGNFDLGTRQIDSLSPLPANRRITADRSWTDDKDYFLDGQSFQTPGYINTVSIRRHKPLYIDQPNVWLEATWNTAITNAQNVTMDFLMWYRTQGQK